MISISVVSIFLTKLKMLSNVKFSKLKPSNALMLTNSTIRYNSSVQSIPAGTTINPANDSFSNTLFKILFTLAIIKFDLVMISISVFWIALTNFKIPSIVKLLKSNSSNAAIFNNLITRYNSSVQSIPAGTTINPSKLDCFKT